jgi:HK97 family phage prohead protease
MNKIERRYVKQELRVSDDAKPVISGYAAVFESQSENLGFFSETIDPHAFDSVMASNPDVRALWNHDSNHPLGRTTSGTLRIKVDARGLAYEIDPPDTHAAHDLLVSMRRKDVTGSSFGFTVKRDQWTDNADGSVSRKILEFDELFDVSPVTFPAYPAAASQVSSLPRSMPAEIRMRILAKRGSQDNDDDDTECICGCSECMGDDCENCSNPDCDDENCRCNRSLSRLAEYRRLGHTKKVDGANLTADCFLVVGDPEKTETWKLPWKFPSEEETKSHLRDALARFDQTEGLSDAQKTSAKNKLDKLCKEHGIDVAGAAADDDRAWRKQASARVSAALGSIATPPMTQ